MKAYERTLEQWKELAERYFEAETTPDKKRNWHGSSLPRLRSVRISTSFEQ